MRCWQMIVYLSGLLFTVRSKYSVWTETGVLESLVRTPLSIMGPILPVQNCTTPYHNHSVYDFKKWRPGTVCFQKYVTEMDFKFDQISFYLVTQMFGGRFGFSVLKSGPSKKLGIGKIPLHLS